MSVSERVKVEHEIITISKVQGKHKVRCIK